jgi:nucleoside-diphosphate-sugar epimerase
LLTNFLPVIPILKHANEHHVTRLLFTGTCEEYGINDSPFQEGQTVMPVSPYSWAKSLTALTANFAHQVYELPIVFLRPFTFFGSFQRGTMFIPALFRAIFNRENKFAMSKGEQLREFNYAEDIADAYIKALTSRNIDGETLNLGSGKGFKLSEIAEEIVKLTESPILLQKGALDYRKHELMSIITDTNKAKELLDWNTTTTLMEGLKKTYDWYQNHPGFL